MKKIVNILVLGFLLLSIIGVPVHKHYSRGRLFSVAIFHKAPSCCDSGEACTMHHHRMARCACNTHKHHSCRDQVELIKLKKPFLASKKLKITQPDIPAVAFKSFFAAKPAEGIAKNKTSHPPPLRPVDIQPLFGIFLC